jgi:hypothetical protein
MTSMTMLKGKSMRSSSLFPSVVGIYLIMLHIFISPVESRRLRLDTSPSGGGCTLRQYVRRSEMRVGSLDARYPKRSNAHAGV